VLVSVGDCAIGGGVPALRNTISLSQCYDEAYLRGPTVWNPSATIPADAEIPRLLDRVYPAHAVVKIDHFLPGCPPSADALWEALTALLENRPIALPYTLVKYD
jgi:NAD-reducing hydrogenase small subunit